MNRRKQYVVLALTALMTAGFMATSVTSYFVAHNSLSDSISDQMLPLTSDLMLKAIGDVIRRHSRDSDTLCR
ncbi:MAG: hypothetical protein ACQETO_05365 [Pseudomonadota bacterium]